MQWTEKRRAGQRAARRNGRYIESLADRTRAYPAARAAVRLPAGRKEARFAEQKAAPRERQTETARIDQKGMQCAGRMEVLPGEPKEVRSAERREAPRAGQKEIRRGEPKEAQSAEQRAVLCGRRKGAQSAEQRAAPRERRKEARLAGQKEAAPVKQKAALCAGRKEALGGGQKAAPFERQKEARLAGQMEARLPDGRAQREEKGQARRQRNCAGIQSGRHRIPAGRNAPERTGSRNGR